MLAGGAPGALARSRVPHLTPAERAAVHAYFTDQYEYVKAASEAAPAEVAAYEAEARAIAGECPGALAGAPQEAMFDEGPFSKRPSARQRGEEKRQRIQLDDLHTEVNASLTAAEHQPLAPARLALLAKLKALPPGPPGLAALVKDEVSGIEGQAAQQPSACADIRAWVASGYRSLSPASRTIALGAEAELAGGLRHAFEQLSEQLGGDHLLAVEDPADRALANKIAQARSRVGLALVKSLLVAQRQLETALGLRPRELPMSEKRKTTTPIGTVRTASGGRYAVSVERAKGGSECKAQVQIRPVESGVAGVLGQIFAINLNSESVYCLSDGTSAAPRAECTGGLIEIRARPLPATRRVILRLSDGRQIVSRPVLVPARLGGPAAIYFQALRGPSPIPVSLQELDGRGRVLRTVAVPRVLECSAHPVKYVRGGRITLVRGKAPQGPDFSIVGERYRYAGALHTALMLGTGAEAGKPEPEPESQPESIPLAGLPRPVREHELLGLRKPLELRSTAGCRPHEFSIVFGLLKRSRDTALAEVAGKLVPMSRARIPGSLHIHGVLVYLASESRPERILVRAPSGRIQMREGLRGQAVEQRETCEGESEGPSPAPGGLEGLGETTSLTIGG